MSVLEAVILWLLATGGFALAMQMLFRDHPALWTGSSKVPHRPAWLLLVGIGFTLQVYLLLMPFSYARSGSGAALTGFILFALSFLQYLDKRLRNTPPEQLRRLRRKVGWAPVAWAILLAGAQWYVWSTGTRQDERRVLSVGVSRQEPTSPLWQQTERLATYLREQSAPDLRAAEAHLSQLLGDPAATSELFAGTPGEDFGEWRRWFLLDELVNGLSRHAVVAAKQGDWTRCRQALALAVDAMQRLLALSPPEGRLATVHHVALQAQILLLQLHRIAFLSPRHQQALANALREGERVRVSLAAWLRDLGENPSSSPERESRTLAQRQEALARWGDTIEQGLRQIERERS